MKYFLEIFWGIVFTAVGAGIAALFSWIIWAGALIGFIIYLIGLIAVKSGAIDIIFAEFIDGLS